MPVFRSRLQGDGGLGPPDGTVPGARVGGVTESERAGLMDGLLARGSDPFRRWMIAGTAVAVALLAGISIVLAWRQYDDAQGRALNDLEARGVGGAAVVDTSFAGQISTLEAIAAAPSVVGEQVPRMSVYFARVNRDGALFSGGLGWIDRGGRARASSAA